MDVVEKVARAMYEGLVDEPAIDEDWQRFQHAATHLIHAFPQLEPEWEYAEATPEWGDDASNDEPIGWDVGKSFLDDANRPLEEGRHLVRRALGPWIEADPPRRA